MSIDYIISVIKQYKCNLVEITGGEPLLQEDVYSLIDELIEMNYTVLLETNGSITLERVNPKVIKIVDIKCPSSGAAESNYFENLNYLTPNDEIKFVIGAKEDYEWGKGIINRFNLTDRFQVLFSTAFSRIEPQKVVEWILNDKLKVRFQLQIHKYIWSPNTRKV